MGVQTGRTVQDFVKLLIGAAAGSMYDMKVDSLGDIGLDYPETEMSAWSDAIKAVLVGKPDFSLEFGGPIDNTATSGPSTLLRAWVGDNTCKSFDVQIGVRHDWVAGEQQFGISGTITTNLGVHVVSYKESGGKYKAKIRMLPGSAAPAWGTAAEAVPA
jgi:hypothetical protein